VAHLIAVVAFDLGPVLGFGTVAREVTGLFAVAADSFVWILRLIAFLGHMLCGVAVAASTSGSVGTLSTVSMC
jgi:hypothetical protein